MAPGDEPLTNDGSGATFQIVLPVDVDSAWESASAAENPIPRYHRPHPRHRASVHEAVVDQRAMAAERFEQIKNAIYRSDR